MSNQQIGGAPRLRGLRRVSQLVFFTGFLLLFSFAYYPLKSPIPVDLFLRADPLIALSAMLSLRAVILPLLWFALPIVLLSLLLGRVFCGWICPLGTTIDLAERLFHIRGRAPSKAPPWRRVKYYLLIGLIVTMLLPAAHRSVQELGLTRSIGLSAVYLFDPIALLTRTLTFAGVPAVQWATVTSRDAVMGWNYSDVVFEHPMLARVLNLFQAGLNAVARPAYFRLGPFSFALFAALVALGRYARRFWCRNLCPLGALLGFLGKASPVRLAVSDKCTGCLRCVSECKMGAIDQNPHQYQGPECIACYSCLAVCPEKAISVVVSKRKAERKDELALDRRRVLQAAGLGFAAVVLPKMDWSAQRGQQKLFKISSSRLIRPPGSLAEDSFVAVCVRCGECMKTCPTNTLQPAVGEGGLEAFGSPIIVPRIGACIQQCTACGQVCPTQAITPFQIEEKTYLYLGIAVVNRSTCIAWAADRQCLVCDEACTYNAISQKEVEGLGRPVVDDRVCIGCGLCEWVCPVQPLGAINVFSSGDKRHLSRAEQRALRAEVEPTTAGKQEDPGHLPYPGL